MVSAYYTPNGRRMQILFVAVFEFCLGQGGIAGDEGCFCLGVAVPVVLIFFPQAQLHFFILFGHVRMRDEIIPEIQLLVVTFLTQMKMKHLFGKSLFRVAHVEGQAVFFPAHADEAVFCKNFLNG